MAFRSSVYRVAFLGEKRAQINAELIDPARKRHVAVRSGKAVKRLEGGVPTLGKSMIDLLVEIAHRIRKARPHGQSQTGVDAPPSTKKHARRINIPPRNSIRSSRFALLLPARVVG
jgi:hypothetical protein